ncbi:bifunctional diaminohydroxyphosphoribosylaminopyrimidine deaminase/5-amino-6-(5-phosphoribosylamino)uracil reductase RibD [Rhizobium sp. TH2]|uniref:bifunctional diaminohydroxyphosphoribosylaminopyrimidine deaminase/5-amino-6-(5-phosphoribosylamino)uracil reductase RibD n=1 Tax=Rhizobium sp. TH2 TaxID=2775403 RepID=UPI00215708B0|nr:bifunctional diaminohydroxyphosphoribosylaminopyrimidine deaminase/5-amino-6-(5-phosphoribosylamino)uracil reductase RibD [Rhizobium sp. TH2]UVC10730.1 bifunctional diaminohydroxyphosphoribosylaminopyrimidine deaminase/5-amino-6-(5-phosphoribosylamino)uracil reductase RibD [Rhizobium sp. TH2]
MDDQRHEDERFMAAAIRLSRWHLGATGSNPSVGCLIVKDGVIVGRGVTARTGRPHAETQALADAGEAARGATAYVTLEPCSHQGKTPPCTEALISYGVARVVVAATDPDPRVSGRGLGMLAAAGIEVVAGVLEAQAETQLEAYMNRQRRKRPQVTLKLAVSVDGMIGREDGGQVAITGREARAQSHILRAESDAILIGIGTVLADDPELTCRLPGLEDRSPVRVVLDRRLATPLSSKLVAGIREGHPLLVAGSPDVDGGRRTALETAGVEVLDITGPDYQILLEMLAGRGISSLIVEGGRRAATAFLAQELVDRIMLFSSDIVVGEDGIASPVTRDNLPEGFKLRMEAVFGADRLREYIKA